VAQLTHRARCYLREGRRDQEPTPDDPPPQVVLPPGVNVDE
jgi:hypothetical protein